MTMKRLSIGLLMTLVVSMAIAPAMSQNAFAANAVIFSETFTTSDSTSITGIDETWLEHSPSGNADVEISGNRLVFGSDNEDRQACVVSTFDDLAMDTGSYTLKYVFDNDRTGNENIYAKYFQLGEDLECDHVNDSTDVGVNLKWGGITTDGIGSGGMTSVTGFGTVEAGTPTQYTTLDGEYDIKVVFNTNNEKYNVFVDGTKITTSGDVPFDDNSIANINSIRIYSTGVDSANFADEAYDDIEITANFKPETPDVTVAYTTPNSIDVEITPRNNCVDETPTEPVSYIIFKTINGTDWDSTGGAFGTLFDTETAIDACGITTYNDDTTHGVGDLVEYKVQAVNSDLVKSDKSGKAGLTVGLGNSPIVVINGASQTIAHNANFVVPTATCDDIEDGNIDGNIVQTGTVGGVAGDYVLDYSCTDSTGNTTVESITITRNESGGGSGDDAHKTRPTFGLDWNTHKQLVEGGVTFNHFTIDVTDNFHTDFNRQNTMVGNNNIVAMKVYAPYELQWVEFLFDVPEVGAAHKAKASVFVPFDWSTGDIIQDKVRIDQDVNLINEDALEVMLKMTTCASDDVEEKCYLIAAKVNFNEKPESGVFAFKAVDERNRTTITYLNEGIGVSGDSLNQLETVLVSSPDRDHRGLVTLTQVGDRYDNLWASDDGYTYTLNQFGTFILVDAPEQQVRVDSGDPRTRTHSAFMDLKTYEAQKAKYAYFNADSLISEGKPSFSYEFPTEDSRTQFLKEHGMLEFARGN